MNLANIFGALKHGAVALVVAGVAALTDASTGQHVATFIAAHTGVFGVILAPLASALIALLHNTAAGGPPGVSATDLQ